MAMAIPTERGPRASRVLGSHVIVGHLGTEAPSWPRDPWALRAVLGGCCHREGFLAQRCAVALPLWSARMALGERGQWTRPVAWGDAEAAAWRTGAAAGPGVLTLPGASTQGCLPPVQSVGTAAGWPLLPARQCSAFGTAFQKCPVGTENQNICGINCSGHRFLLSPSNFNIGFFFPEQVGLHFEEGMMAICTGGQNRSSLVMGTPVPRRPVLSRAQSLGQRAFGSECGHTCSPVMW